MTDWIITSSLAILLVLALRFLLKGKISNRLQYALWLLVLVRLLVPYQSGYSSLSALNFTNSINTPKENTVISQSFTDIPSASDEFDTPIVPENQQNAQSSETNASNSNPVKQLLDWIGSLGAIGIAAVIIISNIRFARILRRSRKIAEFYEPVPVYYSDRIQTPCLYGFFRPGIYLPEHCTDPIAAGHIIAHETAHYRHKDHIWSVLRGLCLCLHWYNPLIWVAVWLSKADGEMASDEAAIRELGEDSRAEYGRTLISLTCCRPTLQAMISTATTLYGSKRSLKTRIKQIARSPKTKWIAVVVLMIAISFINLLLFTNPIPKSLRNNSGFHFDEEGIQGSYLFTESGLYIWDHTAGETELSPGMAVKSSNQVLVNDITQIPSAPGSACRLSLETEIYKDTVYNRLYTKPGPSGSGLECATFVPIMDMEPWNSNDQPEPGYYRYIHNDQRQENLYLYFDGLGGCQYIQGNSILTATIDDTTIRLSRNLQIKYRINGWVLSTSVGTYIYQGNTIDDTILPTVPIPQGKYTVVGELGQNQNYLTSDDYLTINSDASGELKFEGNLYSIQMKDGQIYVDGIQSQYHYNPLNEKNYIVPKINGDITVLIFRKDDLHLDP